MSLARRRDRVCIAVFTEGEFERFRQEGNPICKERAHSVFLGVVLNGGNVFLRRYGGASQMAYIMFLNGNICFFLFSFVFP